MHPGSSSTAASGRAGALPVSSADPSAARRATAEGLAAGRSPGRLYVETIRPALLEDLHRSPPDPRAVAALVGGLVAGLPAAELRGSGRGSILACREEGIESVDGDIAFGFLIAGGWGVDRRDRGLDGDGVAALSRDGGLELAVAVISGPEDALRLAPMCTALRRLADPPVILLCDFSPEPVSMSAFSELGADALVGDPEELLVQAAARAPDSGSRRWGMRLTRTGRTLRLAPTGTLNLRNIDRLADVVRSRAGSFDALVIDLRDLAGEEPGAMSELATLAVRVAPTPDAVTVIPAS